MKPLLFALCLLAGCNRKLPAAAPSGDAAIRDFWIWFAAHLTEVGTIEHGREPIARELAAALKRIDSDLTWELGPHHAPKELIISADGLKKLFPTVKRVVAAAPPLPGWKVIAFRPRKELEEIQIGGRAFKMSAMRIVAQKGELIDVEIFVPPPLDDTAKTAVFLLLDALLGEYDVETKIGGIDIRDAAQAPANVRPFTELVKLVDR